MCTVRSIFAADSIKMGLTFPTNGLCSMFVPRLGQSASVRAGSEQAVRDNFQRHCFRRERESVMYFGAFLSRIRARQSKDLDGIPGYLALSSRPPVD